MKTRILYILFFVVQFTWAQIGEWNHTTVTHNNKGREYITYIPSSYAENEQSSLLIVLHGLGSSMYEIGPLLQNVADEHNYILLAPQALKDKMVGESWNSLAGVYGNYPNTDIDDLSFITAITRHTIGIYNINSNNVFVTGFSMGGFMVHQMSQESSLFNAYFALAGTIGSGLDCQLTPKPIAHLHGTKDGTVGYGLPLGDHNNIFGNNVKEISNCWQHGAIITTETKQTNNYSITHTTFSGDVDREIFTVHGAKHEWILDSSENSYDKLIINFFNKYRRHDQPFSAIIYPVNLKGNQLYIKSNEKKLSITVYDITGREIIKENLESDGPLILNAGTGIYFVNIRSGNHQVTRKIYIKQ